MERKTVTAAIIEKNGRILIARRKTGKHLQHLWEFPGGKLEEGETPEECLIREIKEELSIEIEIKEFFKKNSFKYDSFMIDLLAFKCNYVSGTIKKIDHDKIEWVNPEEFGDFVFAPADIEIVEELAKPK